MPRAIQEEFRRPRPRREPLVATKGPLRKRYLRRSGCDLYLWRRRGGWSMRRIAHELGVTVRTLRKWETGVTPIPRTVRRLLEAWEVEITPLENEEFLTEKESDAFIQSL